MQRTILLTGATGFVGSALAAQFLAAGHRVVALSRNDPSGGRTYRAADAAARGFGLDADAIAWDALAVREANFAALDACLTPELLRDVDVVWHVAAEMSYAGSKLPQALAQNLSATAELHRLVSERAPRCRRFYHVSTAYTAGFRERVVAEQLHTGPLLANTYQATKWCAEMGLAAQHQRGHVPVTLFRPSIVVGHRRTGWTAGASFGIFMFLAAFRAAADRGAEHVMLDLDPASRLNLVTIDAVTSAALELTERRDQGREFEVFHSAGDEGVPVGEVMPLLAETAGVGLAFGPPVTPTDELVGRGVALNRAFANTTWDFSTVRLRTELGDRYPRGTPDREALRRGAEFFLRATRERAVALDGGRADAPAAAPVVAPALSPTLALRRPADLPSVPA